MGVECTSMREFFKLALAGNNIILCQKHWHDIDEAECLLYPSFKLIYINIINSNKLKGKKYIQTWSYMYLKYIVFAVQRLKWPFCVALKTNLLTLTVWLLWLRTEQHWKFCQIKFVKWRRCVLKHCEIRALRQMFRSTTCTLHVLSSQNISGFIYLLKWDPIRSILIDKEKCAIPVRRAIY